MTKIEKYSPKLEINKKVNQFYQRLLQLLNLSFAKTPKNYDQIWQNNPEGFGIPRESLIQEVLEDLPESSSILEIGSGNGRYPLEFAQRLQNSQNPKTGVQKPKHKIVAVEISQVGAKLIQEKIENLKLQNLEVICADFLKIELEQEFDIVFCSGLLEELESKNEQIEAVSKMLKMVKIGGKIILKYCLFISGRSPENRVNSELIPNFLANFPNIKFQVETDSQIRFNELSTIQDGQNNIRTQTIIINKTG